MATPKGRGFSGSNEDSSPSARPEPPANGPFFPGSCGQVSACFLFFAFYPFSPCVNVGNGVY